MYTCLIWSFLVPKLPRSPSLSTELRGLYTSSLPLAEKKPKAFPSTLLQFCCYLSCVGSSLWYSQVIHDWTKLNLTPAPLPSEMGFWVCLSNAMTEQCASVILQCSRHPGADITAHSPLQKPGWDRGHQHRSWLSYSSSCYAHSVHTTQLWQRFALHTVLGYGRGSPFTHPLSLLSYSLSVCKRFGGHGISVFSFSTC